MHPPTILQFAEGIVDSDQSETEMALRLSNTLNELDAIYLRNLESSVFNSPRSTCDRKTLKTHMHCLCGQESKTILPIVWKESDYILDDTVKNAGLSRLSDVPPNAYSLATSLCSDSKGVAKLNGRIRQIGLAGETFGLIERHQDGKARLLQGTLKLHKLMLRIRTQQRALLTEFYNSTVSPIVKK